MTADSLIVCFRSDIVRSGRFVRFFMAPPINREGVVHGGFFDFCLAVFSFDGENDIVAAFPNRLLAFVLLSDFTLFRRWLVIFYRSILDRELFQMQYRVYRGESLLYFRLGSLTRAGVLLLTALLSAYFFNVFVVHVGLVGSRWRIRGKRMRLGRQCQFLSPKVLAFWLERYFAVAVGKTASIA